MSTRFSPGSHTRIWEHLNALDDDIQAGANVVLVATLPAAGTVVATSAQVGSTGVAGGYPADSVTALLEVSAAGNYAAQRLQLLDTRATTWTRRGVLSGGVWGWTSWRVQDPAARGKMTKTSTLALSTNTWQVVDAYASTDYAVGVTTDTSTGRITVTDAGRYDIYGHHRWLNLGSASSRAGALVLGTSAPASDGSNVLAMYARYQQDWLHEDIAALDIDLAAGAVLTSWVRCGTTGSFNTANTTFAQATSLGVRRAA